MSAWQPIETAPKDGTIILGFVPGDIYGSNDSMNWSRSGPFVLAIEFDGCWWGADQLPDAYEVNPTHWVPLPEPPE